MKRSQIFSTKVKDLYCRLSRNDELQDKSNSITKQKTDELEKFISKVKKITEIKELTPELVHEFISKE
ncbi:MAG: DUF4368 domain-containing protein [Clostridia bacterium]|nr:DUF4368 domain-containing protein [Clostridia bacterium]